MRSGREIIRRAVHAVCDIDDVYNEIAKKAGVKENLLWILYALDDDIYHTQKEICDHWNLPKTTVNTIIKECVRDGLVVLEAAPEDKRGMRIRMTERGTAYADELLDLVYSVEQRAMEKTLKTCSSAFLEELELFSKNFRDALEEENTKI